MPRIREISRERLDQLERGEAESAHLVEWLAIDPVRLLEHTLVAWPEAERRALAAAAEAARRLGTMARHQAVAAALGSAAGLEGERFETLARHRSDTIRGWAALALGRAEGMGLAERLVRLERFAADSHFGVRELAWLAWRPWAGADLGTALVLLRPWAESDDPNLRRCAIEGTRPRGVWCAHLPELVAEPGRALPLLEVCRSDRSEYVRRSVANWLNDAGKSQPLWVRDTCERWQEASPTRETSLIIKRALRSLAGEPDRSGRSRPAPARTRSVRTPRT